MNPKRPQNPRMSAEPAYLATVWKTVRNEEFPEGPYGSSLFPADKPGKTTPWAPGERVVSRFQDENPAFSAGAAPPPGSEPPGGQLSP